MFPSMAGGHSMNTGYPNGPGGPGAPGGRAPGAPAGSNPSYFTDKKKGEVNELKNVRG